MRRERTTLTVVSAATLLALMNFNATFSTLAEMARDLRAGAAAQTWFLSAIAFGSAVALLVAGSLADDYGRKRVFIGGAVTLALSCFAGAVAPNPLTFVVARVVQGGATAALLATGLGLVAAAYPAGPERARATGVWSAALGLGIALGGEASAGLAELGSWRTWYYVAAAAALLLAITAGGLRDSRAELARRLDLRGVLSLGGGLAALLGAITQGRSGWTRADVVLLFVVAAVLLAAFVLVEARSAEPMLDLGLFRRHAFVVATGGAFFTGLASVGLMSYMPTLVAMRLGEPPMAAGASLTVWAGTSFIVSLQVRRVRLGPRQVIVAGLLLCAVGDLMMLGMTGWGRLAPGLVIGGVGAGLLNAALARLAVESVPPERMAMGSGANNTARYIGASVGVAAVVAIVAAAGANAALLACAAIAAAGAAAVVGWRPRPIPAQ